MKKLIMVIDQREEVFLRIAETNKPNIDIPVTPYERLVIAADLLKTIPYGAVKNDP